MGLPAIVKPSVHLENALSVMLFNKNIRRMTSTKQRLRAWPVEFQLDLRQFFISRCTTKLYLWC
jgi:hypothetical protein